MRPALLAANLISRTSVEVRFRRRLPLQRWDRSRFVILGESGAVLVVANVKPLRPRRGRASRFLITLGEPIEFRQQAYAVSVRDVGRLPLRTERLFFNPDRCCRGDKTACFPCDKGAVIDIPLNGIRLKGIVCYFLQKCRAVDIH